MKKTCSKCGKSQPVDNFAKNNSKPDGLQGHCRKCKKVSDALHYQQNKDKQNERNKKNRQRYREEVSVYKKERGCLLCDESEPCCLDFHHTDGDKEFSVSSMIGQLGRDKLFVEIQKCVVVCSNCHRKIHAGLIDLGL